MNAPHASQRLRADGKFFRVGSRRVFVRAVTYGPFPSGWPADFAPDFHRIRSAGFDTLRLYEMPDARLLDAAAAHGLRVLSGLSWGQYADFFRRPALLTAAHIALAEALARIGSHPALAGVSVGNEIPADLVRWMGPARVLRAIEDLIDIGRERAPWLLFGYANYPSTEYLEPANADFTAFNIYLENEDALRNYLKRLHHIAGDRPLLISEFGLDSRRNGTRRQATLLQNALQISYDGECAGFTVYAWSDRWWNNGEEVTDWDFGLTDRAGNDKPALAAIAATELPALPKPPRVSVIICTRNGRNRIGNCLEAIGKLHGCHEVIVVDDGSTDGTAHEVAQNFPHVKLLRLLPSGLSAARNAGAAAASGEILAFTDDDCLPDAEWLERLGRCFASGRFAAAGGPNIPPTPHHWREAVVCAAPGAPSHVMIDDTEAEHLPGCNLAVTRAAFDAIGGFDPAFHTAGDDVDFCWRLREAGFRLGFVPGAFVWHQRRPQLRAYLRQQCGYGAAERLLMKKYPPRFNRHGATIWQGCIYAGTPPRPPNDAIIYHGGMGMAGYQQLLAAAPRKPALASTFRHWRARVALTIVAFFSPRIRAWARCRRFFIKTQSSACSRISQQFEEWEIPRHTRLELLQALLADGWHPAGPTAPWDLEKDGARVLIATERGTRGQSNSLIRHWGAGRPLPNWLLPKQNSVKPPTRL